jgi:hypothetical protein
VRLREIRLSAIAQRLTIRYLLELADARQP